MNVRPRAAGDVAPPGVSDVARTLRVLGTDILSFVARLALDPGVPSTATAEGLTEIRASFGRSLDRLGIDLEVLHAERVPREGGLLFMWNQESHLDHLVLPVAIPRPFISLYNNAIARTPFYGAQLRRSGHLHVDRTDEAQWRAAIARAAARARDGACILVSPEGTRSWDGELLPMKRGAFLMAEAAARPIVCVTLIGGHARMPRGSPFVRGGPMRAVFSEAIDVEGLPVNRLQEIVAETFRETKRRYRG